VTAMTVDLTMADQLQAARANATRCRDDLEALEGRLADAVRRQDYTTAERIKAELPAARSARVMADAHAQALEQALAHLEHELAQRAADEAEERRRDEARAQIERAMGVEREGMAELRRHLADIEPGVAAVRESLRAALACEQAIEYARQAAYQAHVLLGDRGPGMRIFGPNDASVAIQRSPVLHAILHGTAGE
jgi:hypothetical protein